MTEKCTKFESLYIFSSEEELNEHIQICPDCKSEMEKMEKVSELIQEVKPYYIKKRLNSFNTMKIACLICFGLFASMTVGYFSKVYENINSTAYYSSEITTDDYGMQVDNYGLITVY